LTVGQDGILRAVVNRAVAPIGNRHAGYHPAPHANYHTEAPIHNGDIVTDFVRDILYAFRLIRKAPLFALYVIVPLALGIGLNGAIFLLLDTLLLRPLPVRNPEQLVRLVQIVQNLGPSSYYSYDAFEALERKSTSLWDIIGYTDANTAVRDSSGVSRIRCQIVTGNFFTALGVQPSYGRILTSSDALNPAAAPPVVLSYTYWPWLEFGLSAFICGFWCSRAACWPADAPPRRCLCARLSAPSSIAASSSIRRIFSSSW